MFRDNTTQFDMNAKVEQIVFRDRIFSHYARGVAKEDWQHPRQFMRSLSDQTVAGYELVRKTEMNSVTLGILAIAIVALAAAVANAPVSPECPKLEIEGPPGLTTPGDLAIFSLKLVLPNDDKLKIKWEVSLGAIEEGQGSTKISVRADTDKQVSALTATVTVTGLPDGCPNVISETVGVAGNIDYFPIDEYGRLPLNDERGRLDVALAEVKARPSFDLLIFLHAPKSASQVSVAARKNRIERHVIRDRKFAATRVHFVRRDSEQISTQIYMLPRELVETFIWEEDTVLP